MWGLYLTLSAACWAVHVGALKWMGDKLPAAQIVFIFYFFALLATSMVLLVERQRPDLLSIASQPKLLLALALAGITIGLVDYFFVKGLAFGVPMSIYSPLFTTIGLGLIAAIGVFYFAEAMTLTKMIGFAFALVGVFLLAK